MTMDLQQSILNDFAVRDGIPEAVSVLVAGRVETGLGTMIVDEATARTVAPMVAKRLYPERGFKAAIHIERDVTGDWLVAVEVDPIRYLSRGFYDAD